MGDSKTVTRTWEVILQQNLRNVSETLFLLYKSDQRMGAKIFYKDEAFVTAVRQYFNAVAHAESSPVKKEDTEVILLGATAFVDYVQHRFEKYRSRMLTTLRHEVGASFSSLYKNTLVLIKFLKTDFEDDTLLEPLDLPEQQPSPIYTKVEGDRVVLDSGHALHPLLRKEAISETRRYLKKNWRKLEAS
jgi:hypothetical protein